MPELKEVWDLFDKDYRPRGTFIRGNGLIPDGLYHKTVEIIPTDMEGNLLLTRRSMHKKSGAGQLEFPAGSVISGETEEEAALRELKEETGLQPKKIFFLQRARMKGVIRYTYLAYIPDIITAQIKCPPVEVMGYRFVSFKQWAELLTTQEYNAFRLSCYNKSFMENMEKLVNRYTAEKAEETAAAQKAPLTPSSRLGTKKPRHLDHRCYETDPITQPEADPDWEPDFEQGDDGA